MIERKDKRERKRRIEMEKEEVEKRGGEMMNLNVDATSPKY
jgi:hypothetical protein